MDELRLNKVFAGFLFAGLLLMAGIKVADIMVPHQELAENAWITAPGDFNVIFRTEPKDQILAVSEILGFDITMVSPEFGNA